MDAPSRTRNVAHVIYFIGKVFTVQLLINRSDKESSLKLKVYFETFLTVLAESRMLFCQFIILSIFFDN